MICYGATSGISSFVLGVIVKWLGNSSIVAFGFIFHVSIMVWFLLWETSHQLLIIFYVAGGILGVCEAIWSSVTNGEDLFSEVVFQFIKLQLYCNFMK